VFFEIECYKTFNDIHNLVKVRPDVGSAAVYGRQIKLEKVIKWTSMRREVCGSHPRELE